MSSITDIQDSNIPEFYKGKSVFITGATGFIGKVLLEKLLRSCPGLKNAYILIREKRGKDPGQRIKELLSCKVFDLVKTENPGAVNKVVGVTGDVALPLLGVSQNDLNNMATNVSIVFHVAATVKFNEHLQQAVDVHLLAIRRLLELCHKLPNIVALIHVSTAYSNYNRTEVEEIIYPSSVSPQQIIETTKCISPELIDSFTKKVMGDCPNTYVFTKGLAENLLAEECGSLPVAIVRPSGVSATWKEPYPGWIDSLNGPCGISIAVGKGVLQTIAMHGEAIADIIPVDVVSNLMIAVAWYTAIHRPNSISVYNCTSGSVNKTTWNEVMSYIVPMLVKYPSAELFRYPKLTCRRSILINKIYSVWQHYLPAFCADVLAYIFFQKPRMMKLCRKVHNGLRCLEYFGIREWIFRCDNVLMLDNLLSKSDRENFYFNVRELKWDSFWENHVLGCRKYILKEDPSTIPAARKNLRRKYIITQFIYVLLAVGVWIIFFLSYSALNKEPMTSFP